MDSPVPATPPPSGLARAWRLIKGTIIFLVVVFHLLFLVIRNPLDLWSEPIYGVLYARVLGLEDWDDKEVEGSIESLCYRGEREMTEGLRGKDLGQKKIDQAVAAQRRLRWLLWADHFTRKYANFVGCEQQWNMFSPRMARGGSFLGYRFEFADGSTELVRSEMEPARPTRFFHVGTWQERKLQDYLMSPSGDLTRDDERPLWEAYARFVLRRWKKANPDEPRTLTGVTFVKRHYSFPAPNQDPTEFGEPETTDVCSFDAQGRVRP